MALPRRTVLGICGASVTGLSGCIGGAEQESVSETTDTQTPTQGQEPTTPDETAQTPDRSPVADSRWIENPSEDVEIYSSDEPPVSEYDEILSLFDRTVNQDEFEGRAESRENPDQRLGEPVSTEVSADAYEAVHETYEDDEYYRGDTDGWIFDHRGTLVTLTIGIPH